MGQQLINKWTNAYKKLKTTNDFQRSVYLTMLAEFPLDWLEEFWSAYPIQEGTHLIADDELVKHLWQANNKVPVTWDYTTGDAIEPFLISKGIYGNSFIKKILFRNNQATYIPGITILSWFYPLMGKVFNAYDIWDMAYKLIDIFTSKLLPQHISRRVKKVEKENVVHSYLVYCSDKNFSNMVKFNFDFVAGEQFKSSSKILSLPAFNNVEYICDTRTVDDVLWTGKAEYKGSDCYVEGDWIGKKTTFYALLKKLDIDLGKIDAPDAEVFHLHKDYYCPLRKRIVLYANCAYGAPLYMICMQHHKLQKKKISFLQHLVEDADLEKSFSKSELEKKHGELVKQLENKIRAFYHAQDQSLSLNGKHFVKNTPAKILKDILLAYTREGKTEFEYKEFKADFEISNHQKNSNFEIRFYRLMEKLDQEKLGLSIVKNGRGTFTLICDRKIDFREIG